MNVPIRASDYLPEPPTPNSRAFPYGYRIILAIRAMCSVASMNITNFICLRDPPITNVVSELYSS